MNTKPLLNVLIVDDDARSLFAMEAILQGLDANLVCVQSGEAALREVLHHEFSVVILDVMMPGMDGFETARLLVGTKRGKRLLILFLTAALQEEIHQLDGYALGAVDYLLKPVAPPVLRAKVAVLLELARAQAALEQEILERKRTEELLRQLNDELEQRVAERTARLVAANRELERSTYAVAHDLRTPILAIDGYSCSLLEEYAAYLPAEAQDCLRMTREHTQHLDRLVSQLLNFACPARQPLHREWVVPAPLVQAIVARLQAEHTGRQIEIIYDDLPACYTDPALLEQVYRCLLANAFTCASRQPVSRIEIGCHNNCTPGQEVYFVKHKGADFDGPRARKRFSVFERRRQPAKCSDPDFGLALVEGIIQRHGGRVWAEDADQGTTISFTLEGGTDLD